ncbi:MAG: type IV secretory system conjugative DNA transfer family protein [Microbacterium sp.]
MNSSTSNALAWVLVGILGAAAVAAAVTTGAAVIVTMAACGAGPTERSLFIGFSVLSGRVEAAATSDGCTPSLGWVVAVTVALVLIVLAMVVTACVAWSRWKRSDIYFLQELRSRTGFAHASDLHREVTPRAIRKQATKLRPQLAEQRKVTALDAAWQAGTSRLRDVLVSIEESVIVLGPPRSGKGYRMIINAILDWPGPLVTTSTTTDNLRTTRAHRATLGKVAVFDPQGLSGEAHPVRISPITGCEDPLTATQRAAVLVAGAGMSGGQNEEWAEQAKAQLASLLCAAALDNRTVEDLARWGSSPSTAHEAVDVLASHPSAPSGWASALTAVLEGDPRMLGNIWFGVTGAVGPLRIPAIAEAMTPRRGEPAFDVAEFLSGQNTLYLIGTKSGSGAVGGYLAALLDDIVESGRRRALASPGSRIDPPLGLILDEIANMFVWPQLPNIMSDGGGRGICPIVVLQSRKQAEVVWSAAEMHAVFGAATVKIQLGGSTDGDFLGEIQTLLGDREVTQRSRSYSEQGMNTSEQIHNQPLMTSDEVRRLPKQAALMIVRNVRPILLDLTKWTDRKDSKRIIAGQNETEESQRAVFAQQHQQRTLQRSLLEGDGHR